MEYGELRLMRILEELLQVNFVLYMIRIIKFVMILAKFEIVEQHKNKMTERITSDSDTMR